MKAPVIPYRLHKYLTFIYVPLLFTLLQGCLGTAYLKKDEKLLYSQKFNGAQHLSQEDLKAQLSTKPNKRFLQLPIVPYVWIHQLGRSFYDREKFIDKKEKINATYQRKSAKTKKEKKDIKLLTKKNKKIDRVNRSMKEGNLLMRWGEPLSIFDHQKEQQATYRIKSYLLSQGYFNANVEFKPEVNGKLVGVDYNIELNNPYVLDKNVILTKDTSIKHVLVLNEKSSNLKAGEIYRQSNITTERDRIASLLKDNGYYGFEKHYVSFQIDTFSTGGNKVIIYTKIESPENGIHEKRYLDSVIFISDKRNNNYPTDAKPILHNRTHYIFNNRKYSTKILDWRNFLHPGELYSRNNTLETQSQLSSLDIFKSINIKYDTTGGKFTSIISATSANKFQTSSEVGIDVNQTVVGPFLNLGIRNRNTFGGLELMEINGNIRSIQRYCGF